MQRAGRSTSRFKIENVARMSEVGFFSHPDDNAEKGSLPVLWLLPGILLIILFLSHSVRNISSNYFFIVLSSTD